MATKTPAPAPAVSLNALEQRIRNRLLRQVTDEVKGAAKRFESAGFPSNPEYIKYLTLREVHGHKLEGTGFSGYSPSTWLDAICDCLIAARVEKEFPDAVRAFMDKVEGMLP